MSQACKEAIHWWFFYAGHVPGIGAWHLSSIKQESFARYDMNGKFHLQKGKVVVNPFLTGKFHLQIITKFHLQKGMAVVNPFLMVEWFISIQ